MNFLGQGYRKLSSDRQIDRQTDALEIVYHAALWVFGNTQSCSHPFIHSFTRPITATFIVTYFAAPCIASNTLIRSVTHSFVHSVKILQLNINYHNATAHSA